MFKLVSKQNGRKVVVFESKRKIDAVYEHQRYNRRHCVSLIETKGG